MGYGEKISRNLRDLARATRSGPQERRKVARRYVHDGLRQAVPFIGTDDDGVITFSATRDRTIGRSLYVEGAWDRAGLPAALQRSSLDLDGRLMVEVGANIGTQTIQAARLGARVLAVEPEPLNYRLLRGNVAVNLLDDRVTCVQAACSSTSGLGYLQRSDVNDGDHRLSDTGDVLVRLLTLDDVVTEQGIDPADVALLWVDVQGHEGEVIAGATKVMAGRPVVMMELSPDEISPTGRANITSATEGYRTVYDMRTDAPTSLNAAMNRYAGGQHTDLLFVP